VREAHFLSALQHRSLLIRIHGAGSLEILEHFFVVLDRVESTLDDLTKTVYMMDIDTEFPTPARILQTCLLYTHGFPRHTRRSNQDLLSNSSEEVLNDCRMHDYGPPIGFTRHISEASLFSLL
jgi:hypothetical protein